MMLFLGCFFAEPQEGMVLLNPSTADRHHGRLQVRPSWDEVPRWVITVIWSFLLMTRTPWHHGNDHICLPIAFCAASTRKSDPLGSMMTKPKKIAFLCPKSLAASGWNDRWHWGRPWLTLAGVTQWLERGNDMEWTPIWQSPDYDFLMSKSGCPMLIKVRGFVQIMQIKVEQTPLQPNVKSRLINLP